MSDCPTPSKVTYPSQVAAQKAINGMARKGVPIAVHQRPYLCQCGAWHQGHDKRFLTKVIRSSLNSRNANRPRGRR